MTPERRKELESKIEKMQKVSNTFYQGAVAAGVHPFLEFCGFLNEYIKICQKAMEEGIDFTETSSHGDGVPLPVKGFHAAYIAEKLNCIYGTSLAKPEMAKIFMTALFKEAHR